MLNELINLLLLDLLLQLLIDLPLIKNADRLSIGLSDLLSLSELSYLFGAHLSQSTMVQDESVQAKETDKLREEVILG